MGSIFKSVFPKNCNLRCFVVGNGMRISRCFWGININFQGWGGNTVTVSDQNLEPRKNRKILLIYTNSVVDRPCYGADSDPTFHFNTDPDPDPSPSLTHIGKSENNFFTFIQQNYKEPTRSGSTTLYITVIKQLIEGQLKGGRNYQFPPSFPSFFSESLPRS